MCNLYHTEGPYVQNESVEGREALYSKYVYSAAIEDKMLLRMEEDRRLLFHPSEPLVLVFYKF